jgi:fibronectin type III domain protein/chondroitinase B-like protein
MTVSEMRFFAALLAAALAVGGCGGGSSATSSGNPPAPTDSTAPSVPTNLIANPVSSSQINLSWNASTDNAGVTGYRVYRGGAQIATTSASSYSNTGLSASTPYSYTVAAYDAAGNNSASSPSASATTPASSGGSGTSYYVSTTGNDNNAGSASSPFQTIGKGLSVLAPGDNLVIRDGTYAGAANSLTNLPNGNPGNTITIAAENEGNVIVTAGLTMDHTDSYLTFQGLRFQDSNGRAILGNHLKFFRNEFKGGCASGNCVNTAVGTNDFNDTADILFEDNWWHGQGGRYNLLVYNANRVVVRRAVIRHDAGWTDTKGDPEAGLNFYNSSDCSAQNVIIVDNDLTYHTWQGAFYSVYNSASPNATNNNSWYGNIALKSPVGGAFRLDGNGPQIGHIVQDMVLWDAEYAAAMGSGSSNISGIAMTRITAGRNSVSSSAYGLTQFASAFSGSVKNLIVTRTNNDFIGVPATFFDSFANNNTSAGTGRVTYSPFTNGLLYLTRIETGSALKTAGENGDQIGAQIVNRIGAPGTLQGESGWNVDSGTVLWPFPFETRIKQEMCSDPGITRGFCSSLSLTDYIHNYLGNGNPY